MRELRPENFNGIGKTPSGPETEQRGIKGNMRGADPKILFDSRIEIR